MNRDELQTLIRLVEESDIDELEVRRWGRTVRIVKRRAVADGEVEVHTVPAPAARPAAEAPAPEPESAPQPESSSFQEVLSPMVGTFYRAPAPEAPPFVDLGATVRKGETLCILEAMKLMNELEAEISGVVRKIHVENGQPVEYGQVLFEIEPT